MEDKELSFWDHLDELRWAIARIVVIWFVLAIGFFIAMPYIFDTVILGPCHNDFAFYKVLYYIGNTLHLEDEFFTSEFDITLQSINIAAPFFVHLTTSFILSIVVTVPYLLWEIWKFIRPALYENEYRGIKKALALGSIMFFLGCAVGYFMVFPLALRFLATYNLSSSIIIEINLNSYIDTFMMLTLCMGLCFELPLVTWLLSLMGILDRQTLRTYRRHAIVVIVIVAAIITPTGDPFTLTAVSLPLYLLYELSIFMIKDSKDEDDEDDDDDDDPGTGIVKSKPSTPSPTPSPAATATAAAATAAAPQALEGSEPKQLESTPDALESTPDALPTTPEEFPQDPSMEEIEEILRRQREAAEEAKKATMATAVAMTSEELVAQTSESPTAHYEAYSDEAEIEEWEKENAPKETLEEETASTDPESEEPGTEESSDESGSSQDPEEAEIDLSQEQPEPASAPEPEPEPEPEPAAKPEEPAPNISSNGINISGIRYDYRRFQGES